ncbi:hypothetical protein LJC28_03975, partial [Dysgonomonas sp. OttesenSCG-928-D17]|nr:hypothetical protein [Dysgonomonas sp. OttesenSCG-928-D17]
DGTTERTTKYKYLNTGVPTGIMMNPLKFTRKKNQIYQSGTEVSAGGSCSGPGTAQLINYWQYSSNSQIPSANNNVGYSYVEVINEGIGHESFTYWNQKNYSKDYLKPLPDPRNGNLLEHSVYTSSGQLSKKTTNKYTILKAEPYFVNAVMEDIYVGGDAAGKCNSMTNPYSRACPYNRILIQIYPSIKTWIEKTQTTEENYFPQGKIIHDKNYTYNPSNLALAKKEESTDNGEIQKQYFVYPTDYNTTGYPSYLVSQNIINRPTEVVNTIKKENGEFVVNGTVNYYNNSGNISSVSNLEFTGDLLVANFKFSNKTANGISSGSLGAYSPFTQYAARATSTYTTNGDLQNIILDNNENVVYLWGYKSQYPVAEIVNSTYAKVRDALGGQSVVDNIANSLILSESDLTKLKSLQTLASMKDSHVTIYTYKPLLGVSSVISPSGRLTYYDYDYLGRLKEIYFMENNTKKLIQQFNYHFMNQ